MGLFKKAARAVVKKGIEKATGVKLNDYGYPIEDEHGFECTRVDNIHLSGVTYFKKGKNPQKYIPKLRPGVEVKIISEPVEGHPEALLVIDKKDRPLGWIPTGYRYKKLLFEIIDNNTTYYARAKRILGGTKDKPTYGLIIEVALYQK